MKNSLRVATFNIQHGAKGDYGRGYPELVAAACVELQADIIGLQEVDRGVSRSQKADLAKLAAEATGMDYHFAKARTFRGRGEYGNALLVRGEIRGLEVIKLKGDRHKVTVLGHTFKPVPEPRNAILATAVVEGHEISVGNTHTGGDVRKQQLGIAAAAFVTRPKPQLFMGDFNVRWPEAHKCMQPYGLEVLNGARSDLNWNPKSQVDMIAVNGLRCISMRTQYMGLSDHLALIAELEIWHGDDSSE